MAGPVTEAQIRDALYDWVVSVLPNTIAIIANEVEDAPNAAFQSILYDISRFNEHPYTEVDVPAWAPPAAPPDGTEKVLSEAEIEVVIDCYGTDDNDGSARRRANRLINSLRSLTLNREGGLWRTLGRGGILQHPTDLIALETGNLAPRVQFRVQFHAAIQDTFGEGDYILNVNITGNEAVKGELFNREFGNKPHPKPEDC